MTTVFMGVVAALAIFAIVAKTCAGKPKKAEVEKGEVIKQLLALADRESSISANRPPRSKDLRHASTSATHNDTSRREAPSPMSPARPILLRRNLTDAETEEQIRKRAYELYQGRGGVDGNPADDWEQAREEVLRQKTKAATTSF
jgi:Protein of unknown function (DUF2934)